MLGVTQVAYEMVQGLGPLRLMILGAISRMHIFLG